LGGDQRTRRRNEHWAGYATATTTYAAEELAFLPEPQHHLMPCDPFEVEIDQSLLRLAEEADRLIDKTEAGLGP
jgi:nicotinate phosphoribosyltransferase